MEFSWLCPYAFVLCLAGVGFSFVPYPQYYREHAQANSGSANEPQGCHVLSGQFNQEVLAD
jgi:hypothetical protein